ncbi:MAG TPA: hypothetical protein VK427_15370, partial [Kofleriaceae bacterium]|nr:hypothetical protein [Kofleriaceae bacterium]
IHSGYGVLDRLWYPYARTREPPPELASYEALARLLDGAHPHHVYRIEQTAQAYTIRGDLWDYLIDRRRTAGGGVLLSLTLEMGWKPHRHERTLRRHQLLFDFLLHAVASHRTWAQPKRPVM